MDSELQIAALEGEIALHHEALEWWATELDYWRSKYLQDHPELDNWNHIETARKDDEERGF